MALHDSTSVDKCMFRVITKTQAQACLAETRLEPCKTTMMEFFCDISYTAGIYHLKVNKINTRTKFETCSKLTIKTSFWCLYC